MGIRNLSNTQELQTIAFEGTAGHAIKRLKNSVTIYEDLKHGIAHKTN